MLVQLGDILDRGEDELAILSLLKSLNIQAKAHGGAVFQVCVCSAIFYKYLGNMSTANLSIFSVEAG